MDGSDSTQKLGCPRCRELEAEVERLQRQLAKLQAQVDRLTAQLDETRRAGKRQAAPFRRRQLVPEAEKKPPGRPPGHEPAHRAAPDFFDQIIDVPLAGCPQCGGPLQDRQHHEQTQIDIPAEVLPEMRKFVLESGYCPCCHKRFQSRHPRQTSDAIGAAAHQIGPNALAFAVDAKYRLGIPLRKICDLLERIFLLPIAPGTIVRASQRIARAAAPTFQQLLAELRASGVVNVDETGWRVLGKNAWLWVFTTPQLTIYCVRHSRGHEILLEVLGEEFGGIVGCDGFAAYRLLGCLKAQCLAHLLRRAAELETTQVGRAVQFPRVVAKLLREAIRVGSQRDTYSERGFAGQVTRLERRLDRVVASRLSSEPNRKFRDHLRRHRDEIFTFLHHDNVEPTNNAAERATRLGVIVRKISAGNRSEAGAHAQGILTSLVVTCWQRGHDFIQWLRDLLELPKPQAVPIPFVNSS